MLRRMLKSKIHRATVTDSNVSYEGSITIDRLLMEAADLCEFEQVSVWDLANGARLDTYVIPAPPGSGTVAMNGAAAHLVKKGDEVIISSFAAYGEAELTDFVVRKVFVDRQNRMVDAPPAARGTGGDRPAELC